MQLEITDLTKEFHGFKAVNGVSLSLNNGVYGLKRENGSGNTTLMMILCKLINPTKGIK